MTSRRWTDYVSGFGKVFPKVDAQSLFTALYYDGMQAILEGLDQTGGKLDDPAAFQSALASLKPTFPRGSVTLDANRNSVQPNYVVQIVKNGRGWASSWSRRSTRSTRPSAVSSARTRRTPSRDEPAKATRQPAAVGEASDRLIRRCRHGARYRAPCRQPRRGEVDPPSGTAPHGRARDADEEWRE